jgi:hypothetical protein
MGSQLFDSPPDPFLAFASETPVASAPAEQAPAAEPRVAQAPVAEPLLEYPSLAPAIDREPAFLRVPATYDSPSLTSIVEQPPPDHVRLRLVGTIAIVAGLLAAFVAGYGVAYRVIASAPAASPTLVIATPRNPLSPPRTAPPAELPREASAPAPEQQANSSALPVPAPPPAATRTRVPSRAAARTAAVPTTSHAGVIEVLAARGAQVFLDGAAVGRAPLSIADVSEGTHEVRVELDGFRPWAGSIHVKGGSRARVGASLER